MPVTLVEVFEVPEGREEEFLDAWAALAEVLKSAPGCYGTRLLRRTGDLVGRFAFVNIALWESGGAWQAVTGSEEYQALLPAIDGFTTTPGLYEVAYQSGTV